MLHYDDLVHELAQRVRRYIRQQDLLRAGDRVAVAVSGGADSVALLRLMLELRQELGLVLSVAHFNHQIRGDEADADQEFVAALAQHFGLEMHGASADTRAHAKSQKLSLEAAARELRYEFFRRLLDERTVNKVATAHTIDDQAETLLLRLVRGAGITGLAGIYSKWIVGTRRDVLDRGGPAIIRPVLGLKRNELQDYLRNIAQSWREDSTNVELHYARNRVRHELLPAIEGLNPRVREVLAETAEIARAEEEYWNAELERILPQVWKQSDNGAALLIEPLLRQPLAVRRRLVRAVAERLGLKLEFEHVEQVLNTASTSGPKSAELPGGCRVQRAGAELRFQRPSAEEQAQDYEYLLPVPGIVDVPETGSRFEAILVTATSAENAQATPQDGLLSGSLLGQTLTIRNWRPGDRYWPAHTKAPKKIKDLLQAKKSRSRRGAAGRWRRTTGESCGCEASRRQPTCRLVLATRKVS